MNDLQKRIEAALAKIALEDHEAAFAIHAALSTQDGRRAAGLPRRGRGKTYDPAEASIGTEQFEIVLDHALGHCTLDETIIEIVRFFGESMDDRSALSYINAILPRAQGFAALLNESKQHKNDEV